MCVVQVRQPDVTIVNMTMSVMHQVLEKHQFMPDVIAMVGEGVLTKNRYGEKQRGKMLSLFMSAKMYVRLVRLFVQQVMAKVEIDFLIFFPLFVLNFVPFWLRV